MPMLSPSASWHWARSIRRSGFLISEAGFFVLTEFGSWQTNVSLLYETGRFAVVGEIRQRPTQGTEVNCRGTVIQYRK
jgi:hypothetical protein